MKPISRNVVYICKNKKVSEDAESYLDFNFRSKCTVYLFFFSFFFFPLHFNVLMQPKAMKHSILSTYIDTHRVVLTMYVV